MKSIAQILMDLEEQELELMRKSFDLGNGEEYREHRARAEAYNKSRSIVLHELRDAIDEFGKALTETKGWL